MVGVGRQDTNREAMGIEAISTAGAIGPERCVFISPRFVAPHELYCAIFETHPGAALVMAPPPRVDSIPPPPMTGFMATPRIPITYLSNNDSEGHDRSCRHPHDRRR